MLLTENGIRTTSGRVRGAVSSRSVRWYGTRGLIDPPVLGVDRMARYGRRHVAQLLAIKRLQSQGVDLTTAGSQLLGLSTEELLRTAGVPRTSPGLPAPGPEVKDDRRLAFWAERSSNRGGSGMRKFPGKTKPDVPGPLEACSVATTGGVYPAGQMAQLGGAVAVTKEIQVGPVRISVWQHANVTHDDLSALSSACEPLVAVLRQRGLLGVHESWSDEHWPRDSAPDVLQRWPNNRAVSTVNSQQPARVTEYTEE